MYQGGLDEARLTVGTVVSYPECCDGIGHFKLSMLVKNRGGNKAIDQIEASYSDSMFL